MILATHEPMHLCFRALLNMLKELRAGVHCEKTDGWTRYSTKGTFRLELKLW
jgi:hypothetical protein